MLREGDHFMYLLIYVDDIILACGSKHLLERIKSLLNREFYMKDLGPISQFLGIQIERKGDGIYLNQSQYLRNLLKRFNMTD